MAEKRMFAKTIIDSDAFLDMPLSTQALYFHLSMRADDEGFINNPKRIQRTVGASDDDLKLLAYKNFIIPFESGVVVIKHWLIHNTIRKDRLKRTVYHEERNLLSEKENRVYALTDTCRSHDNQQADECPHRLDKIRLDKNRLDEKRIDDTSATAAKDPFETFIDSIVACYEQLTGRCVGPTEEVVIFNFAKNIKDQDIELIKKTMTRQRERWKPRYDGDQIRTFSYFIPAIKEALAVKGDKQYESKNDNWDNRSRQAERPSKKSDPLEGFKREF